MDLTDVPLFQDMTLIERDGYVIDLHNNYDCVGINYDKEKEALNIVFIQAGNIISERPKLCLIFKNSIVVNFDFSFNKAQDAKTVNSFYRGRFEDKGSAIEYYTSGNRYFYIEFENGNKIELFSSSVLLLEI